ncbi:MAG: hypothetical protein LBV51_03100 [Acholeplasmatales bacterium]|jgi:hypothetical protein|nr:hypothetical protein [Acholeplasmatales bacterium]
MNKKTVILILIIITFASIIIISLIGALPDNPTPNIERVEINTYTKTVQSINEEGEIVNTKVLYIKDLIDATLSDSDTANDYIIIIKYIMFPEKSISSIEAKFASGNNNPLITNVSFIYKEIYIKFNEFNYKKVFELNVYDKSNPTVISDKLLIQYDSGDDPIIID